MSNCEEEKKIEYFSEYYTDNSDNEEISTEIQEMYTIEKQVYEVYKYLDKETISAPLLKHLRLSDVYSLLYPDYVPLF